MGFMKGKGAKLVLFIDGDKMPPLDVKSWNLDKVVEEIADGVNGEDEDRLDNELKHYALSIDCFNATAEKLKRLIRYDEAAKANTRPEIAFGIQLIDEAGAANSFSLKRAVIDGWKWASGGRTDRMMLTIPIRGNGFGALA